MPEGVFHRGDVVVCSLPGDYGKPRPALVVQSDAFNATHASVTLCPITSELTGLTLFRVPVRSSASTGLPKDSEVMVDKMMTVRRARLSRKVGRLPRAQMALVDSALGAWLDLPGTT